MNPSRIDVNNLDAIINGLGTVLADISGIGTSISYGFTYGSYVTNTQATGPFNELVQYRNRLSVIRIPAMSLTFLVLGLVLFFVTLMTDLMVERALEAMVILRSRGASRSQVFGSLLTQCLGLSLIALLVGPPLAIGAAYLLTQRVLPVADRGPLRRLAII